MIGWDEQGRFQTDDFASQARQALQHIVAVLAEAGGRPEHIVRMTWYVVDKREYLAAGREVGTAFREIIGHFDIAMTAVQVVALIEDRAQVEIEATAVIPDEETGMAATAHVDTFARDRLPAPADQPEFLFELPELQFPERLNCAAELLDRRIAQGWGDRRCADRARRHGVDLRRAARDGQPDRQRAGRRHGPAARQPGAAARRQQADAGGVLVRGDEGGRRRGRHDADAARQGAGADHREGRRSRTRCATRALADELALARGAAPALREVRRLRRHGQCTSRAGPRMARQSDQFDDGRHRRRRCRLLAFTSGTTGQPKATMHFHRDVLATCVCFPPHVLRATPDDVFIGSPPLAFTFGLGGLLLFPMRVGAATVLLAKASPPDLLDGIAPSPRHGAVHRADLVPGDGRGSAAAPTCRSGRAAAAQMRVGRRGAAGGHPHAVARGHRSSS